MPLPREKQKFVTCPTVRVVTGLRNLSCVDDE
jgi:hypothetical protein